MQQNIHIAVVKNGWIIHFSLPPKAGEPVRNETFVAETEVKMLRLVKRLAQELKA